MPNLSITQQYLTITQFSLSLLIISCSIVVLLFAIGKLKSLFVSGTMIINREIENGEHVTFHCNLYSFDSQNKIFKRIMYFAEAGIKRKEFCFNRFQQILNQENVKPISKPEK